MKPKVYVETSVVSYLTAWRSRDIVVAGNQQTTREWWDRRVDFDSWNCAHIANPAFRPKIDAVIRLLGYQPPIICTPLELLDV